LNPDAGCLEGDDSGAGRTAFGTSARFLARDYESAARSLREGIAEILTLRRLKLPPSLYKCLATANLIESPRSGVAKVPWSVFQLFA
jgi:hypothetical protein